MMKLAYDLHTVHAAILQKRNNVCKPHSNNIHQLYNSKVTYRIRALKVSLDEGCEYELNVRCT